MVPESNRLQRICSDLGVDRVVRWLRDVSMNEQAAEYGRADIFCLPSVQEGFGIVFLEAMAAGRPMSRHVLPLCRKWFATGFL
jgi:glycosyltransferase involved in cell wall biosynthesis